MIGPRILHNSADALWRRQFGSDNMSLSTMKPMFLRDVEAAETKSPFFDLITAARNNGAEYPQIWHLFAFQPHATKHLERFTQAIMREPGPLSPGLRELIAAYTSARNHCPF